MSQTAINYTNITFGNGENKFRFFFLKEKRKKKIKISGGKGTEKKKNEFRFVWFLRYFNIIAQRFGKRSDGEIICFVYIYLLPATHVLVGG